MKNLLFKNIELLIFICLILLGTIIYFVIDKDNGNKYDVEFVENLEETEESDIQMMLINDNNKCEFVSFNSIDVYNDNEYEKIFSLYNEYQNSLPLNYSSPFKNIIINRKIYKEDNVLKIEIDSINNNDANQICECLISTYKLLGIDKIELIIDNGVFILEN